MILNIIIMFGNMTKLYRKLIKYKKIIKKLKIII